MEKYLISILIIVVFVNGGGTTAHALECGDSITSSVVLTKGLDCSTGYAALEVFAHNVTNNLI